MVEASTERFGSSKLFHISFSPKQRMMTVKIASTKFTSSFDRVLVQQLWQISHSRYFSYSSHFSSSKIIFNFQVNVIKYPNEEANIEDLSIGRHHKLHEHVTDIIFSWDQVANTSSICLSISFASSSIPVATSAFLKIFSSNLKVHDVVLLGKTKKLTSVSDWHDISIAAFNTQSKGFQQWYASFKQIYYHHASDNRKSYSLLDPRPALLEANARHSSKVNIGYFKSYEVCSTTNAFESSFTVEEKLKLVNKWTTSKSQHSCDISWTYSPHAEGDHHGESRCKKNSSPIEFFCGSTSDQHRQDVCLTLDAPHTWKKSVDRNVGMVRALTYRPVNH